MSKKSCPYRTAVRRVLQSLTFLSFAAYTVQPVSGQWMANRLPSVNDERSAHAAAEHTRRARDVFSRRIAEALGDQRRGRQAEALRLIIRHGKHIDAAVCEPAVIRLVTSSEDRQMRRMAVVAVAAMRGGDVVRQHLERRLSVETDTAVRHTILAVLARWESETNP